MRIGRRFIRVAVCIFIIPVFVVTALLSSQQPALSQTISGLPQLDVPEDPVGTHAPQQAPEISIAVDVRDGHLVARVVDIWGPGRVPRVMRSWTGAANSPAGTGNWQLNDHSNVQGGTDTNGTTPVHWVLEPDGNLSKYRFSQQIGACPNSVTNVYVKNVGTYGTLVAGTTCVDVGGDRTIWQVNETGSYTIYLPHGRVLQFSTATPTSSGSLCSTPCALITRDQDANGNITTYSWTSLANQTGPFIANETDPVGRVTTYGYEQASASVCLSENDRGGCTSWSTGYRVKTATDPYGRVATYTYNGAGQLASVANAAGFTTQYAYDSNGHLSSVTDADGFTTTITWTSVGNASRVTRITVPDGTSTNYAYTVDGNGNVTGVTVTDARNNQTNYAVTSAGDVSRITDPLGNATQFSYDGNHNVTQATNARGTVTTYAYNSHNLPTQIVSASGSLNLTTTMSWDSPDATPLRDNMLSLTNSRGITTSYTYDANDNLTKVDRAVGTADEAVTQYTYTTWGGAASATDPRGNTTTYAYTARHQIQTVTPPAGGTTTYGYDTYDNQTSTTDGNGHTWTAAYNASRLPTSGTDPLGNSVSSAYDANGNRASATDAKNQTTTFAYDSRNRLTSIAQPSGPTTSYQYDAVSNLTKVTNANNNSTSFAYDAENRLQQATDPLGQLTTYAYDQVGNRTSMVDRKGVTMTYTYDAVNRPTQASAGGITVSYTYDANGNRLTLVDPTGTTSYTYDNLDRRTGTTYPDGRSVQFAYDKDGNRTSLVYPGGTASLAYTYDAANRLTQVADGTLQWAFAYDGAGNRTQMTQPNGTQTIYAYLANNWLSSITHQNTGGAFATISYTYDANGNRVSMGDTSGTTTFSYDALNRLTQAVYPGTYGTWSWSYDAVGNRTLQGAPGGHTAYTYDANNRLTQTSAMTGTVTYTYDANGNPTSTSSGNSFTYDAFNRMIQASTPTGSVTYTYNGDGLKVQRVGPDGTTRYYRDGILSIWETDGNGNMTAQLNRDIFGNVLSRTPCNGCHHQFYHTDGLGSTIALTDTLGNVLASTLYDAWGNVRASGSDVGKYRFTGAEQDTTTGLYHMGARFYDPTVGRWLGEDPVQSPSEPMSLNFYAYVANNPLLRTDSTGLWCDDCWGGGGPNREREAFVDAEVAREVERDWIDRFGAAVALQMQINAASIASSLGLAYNSVMGAFSGLNPLQVSGVTTSVLSGAFGYTSMFAWGYGNQKAALVAGLNSSLLNIVGIGIAAVQYQAGQMSLQALRANIAINGSTAVLGAAGALAGPARVGMGILDTILGALGVTSRAGNVTGIMDSIFSAP